MSGHYYKGQVLLINFDHIYGTQTANRDILVFLFKFVSIIVCKDVTGLTALLSEKLNDRSVVTFLVMSPILINMPTRTYMYGNWLLKQ